MSNQPSDEFLPKPPPKGFLASDGTNPFRDDQAAAEPLANSPYASPGGHSAAPIQSDHYEAFLPHRAQPIFWLGLLGLLVATIGSLGLLCCMPLPLFAFPFSIPAWLMGRMDLKAMNAGAMDNSGRSRTVAGSWMGLIGTLIAGGICVTIGSGIVWQILHSAH